MSELEDQRRQLLSQLEQSVDAFPWQDPAAYGDYLAQTYYYSRHSIRLLGAMLARTATGSPFADYCVNAIREELNHDQLALQDLQALGQPLERHSELASCRLMWEPQYYKTEHVSPESVCGYILMLESLAVTRGEHMMSQCKQPDASRFFRVHIAKDEEHTANLLRRIEQFGAEHTLPMSENMQQTTLAYTSMLDEIRARTSHSK